MIIYNAKEAMVQDVAIKKNQLNAELLKLFNYNNQNEINQYMVYKLDSKICSKLVVSKLIENKHWEQILTTTSNDFTPKKGFETLSYKHDNQTYENYLKLYQKISESFKMSNSLSSSTFSYTQHVKILKSKTVTFFGYVRSLKDMKFSDLEYTNLIHNVSEALIDNVMDLNKLVNIASIGNYSEFGFKTFYEVNFYSRS